MPAYVGPSQHTLYEPMTTNVPQGREAYGGPHRRQDLDAASCPEALPGCATVHRTSVTEERIALDEQYRKPFLEF